MSSCPITSQRLKTRLRIPHEEVRNASEKQKQNAVKGGCHLKTLLCFSARSPTHPHGAAPPIHPSFRIRHPPRRRASANPRPPPSHLCSVAAGDSLDSPGGSRGGTSPIRALSALGFLGPGMDPMEQPEPEIAGHYYALQVGSYFLTGYYNVLTNQPHLASQFYTDNSSVVRLDCETGRWSFGETVEVINDMMMSMNVSKVEVKTANFLESWGGAITLLVTGLVQLKGYPVRKRFAQNIVLAPKKDGYFIFSDIFKLICDEYDDQYPVADYNCADNMPQVDASYTMAETGSDYLDGEPEAQETVAPAENHVQHQDPLQYKAGNVIYDETHPEERIPSFPSSTDMKKESPLAPPHPPSSPTLEEPVEEAPKTYASVLRRNVKATIATAETQQAQQLAPQAQSAPVHEKSNLDNHRAVSTPEDEEEFLSVYVGNLSPSTSVFDLEKVFQAFGRIKPDGVAIRSRKEAGVFFGFVEFEDMSGIQNALSASPIELNGRFVHVEERRPNCGFPRGRRGRGRADFSRDQAGGRYDGEYATRSKGTGHQKKSGRQYDSYY